MDAVEESSLLRLRDLDFAACSHSFAREREKIILYFSSPPFAFLYSFAGCHET